MSKGSKILTASISAAVVAAVTTAAVLQYKKRKLLEKQALRIAVEIDALTKYYQSYIKAVGEKKRAIESNVRLLYADVPIELIEDMHVREFYVNCLKVENDLEENVNE